MQSCNFAYFYLNYDYPTPYFKFYGRIHIALDEEKLFLTFGFNIQFTVFPNYNKGTVLTLVFCVW